MIRPGEEVYYVALLDKQGDTILTVPMDTPLKCPEGAEKVDAAVQLTLQLVARGSR